MELRHLRYFVAVAEELHFGRAAVRLHLSQSPLSQQIADLEREIGVLLFNRIGRGIELSAAGADFLENARRILEESEKAVVSAQRAYRGEIGSLAIGFVGAMAYTYLPWVLRAYRARFPDVALVLHEQSIVQQVQALREGRLQVGLLRPPVEASELASEVIFSEPFVVALPDDHLLLSRKKVKLSALRDESFIMYPRRIGGRFYDSVLALCQEAGFSPRVSQEVTQMHAAIGLVTARLGIAIVPASTQVLQVTGVAYRPLVESRSGADIALAWRNSDASPATRAFVEIAREVIPTGWYALHGVPGGKRNRKRHLD